MILLLQNCFSHYRVDRDSIILVHARSRCAFHEEEDIVVTVLFRTESRVFNITFDVEWDKEDVEVGMGGKYTIYGVFVHGDNYIEQIREKRSYMQDLTFYIVVGVLLFIAALGVALGVLACCRCYDRRIKR